MDYGVSCSLSWQQHCRSCNLLQDSRIRSFHIPKKLLIHCLGAMSFKIVPKQFRIFPDHEETMLRLRQHFYHKKTWTRYLTNFQQYQQKKISNRLWKDEFAPRGFTACLRKTILCSFLSSFFCIYLPPSMEY